MFIVCNWIECLVIILFRLLKIFLKVGIGFIKVLCGTIKQRVTIICLLVILIINASVSKKIDWFDVISIIVPIAFCLSQSKTRKEIAKNG